MKILLLNIIFALIPLSYYLDYELRNERKFRKSDKTALISYYTNKLDSLKNEIYVKDSIVMDCEGILQNPKDAIRLKRIYNTAK